MIIDSKNWNHYSPTEIQFGEGIRVQLPKLINNSKTLIVTSKRGRKQLCNDPLLADLAMKDSISWIDDISSNPGLEYLQNWISKLNNKIFDVIIGFGGGSAIDAAKIMSAVMAQSINERNLSLMISNPEKYLVKEILPFYAIPTTSGTGSEVTPFATVWDYAQKSKKSLAGLSLFPKTAIIDPELTYGLSFEVTMSTGLDALNQAFESVWNKKCNPFTALLASRSISLSMKALPRLSDDLNDFEARAMMSEASFLAGLCISQTRTAICHSVGYPLTAHFDVPHGYASAFLMNSVARLVLKTFPDYLKVVSENTGFASPKAMLDKLEEVIKCSSLDNAILSKVSSLEELLKLTDEMFTPGRADNFIVDINDEILKELLKNSLNMLQE
jgi:alcohol dehydrogenase